MTIAAGIRTPNIYTEININTQRRGLPSANHKVLFVTRDVTSGHVNAPIEIVEQSDTAEKFGEGSEAERMMTAALKTYSQVSAWAIALIIGDVQTQDALLVDDGQALLSESGGLIEPEQ